jgi:hypothetical protein
MRSKVSQAARLGCAAGFAALAPAACGDDSAATEDEAAAADDPLAAYTACLAEQGIELPEDWTPFGAGAMPGGGEMPTGMPGGMPTDGEMPTGDLHSGAPGGGLGGAIAAPDGVDEDEWAAAAEACADRLPQGQGGGEMPGGAPPEQESSAPRTRALSKKALSKKTPSKKAPWRKAPKPRTAPGSLEKAAPAAPSRSSAPLQRAGRSGVRPGLLTSTPGRHVPHSRRCDPYR